MRSIVRGDIDGFFGLALDNLIQLLLIHKLCIHVLQFPEDLLVRHIMPGAAVSLLVGNIYYFRQALRLSRETGRHDLCALPYGINTVSLIAFVFLVMLPVRIEAMGRGATEAEAALAAWHAGLIACFGCGLVEFVGAFVAERLRRWTPRAALLSTLASIALTFIAMGFVFQTFAHPIVGLTTLVIVFLTYFGRVRFLGGLPGGLVAVALGTVLARWTLPQQEMPATLAAFTPPVWAGGELWAALTGGYFTTYFTIIMPMGLFSLIGSLQNIESAEAAGDSFPTQPSLVVNGVGTMAAALFGSCFPTTIYIGHPGWKALGARAGYSLLNGAFFTIVCLTGTFSLIAWAVPIDAGMVIVIWIGLVITAQAFQATPKAHAPAVVVGLLPGLAAWGVYMTNSALDLVGVSWSAALIQSFRDRDIWIDGAFALEQGFILTSILLAAATVEIIERRFTRAALWCVVAAGLAAIGLIHSYEINAAGKVVLSLTPAWPWVQGYVIMAVILIASCRLTVPAESSGQDSSVSEDSKNATESGQGTDPARGR